MMVVIQPREKPLSSIKWWILCYVKCNSIAGRIIFGENWSLVRDSLAGKRAENKLNEWEKSMPCGCVCVAGGHVTLSLKLLTRQVLSPGRRAYSGSWSRPLPRTQRLEYHFDLGAVCQLLHGIGVLRVVLEQDGHLECGCLQGPMRRREQRAKCWATPKRTYLRNQCSE